MAGNGHCNSSFRSGLMMVPLAATLMWTACSGVAGVTGRGASNATTTPGAAGEEQGTVGSGVTPGETVPTDGGTGADPCSVVSPDGNVPPPSTDGNQPGGDSGATPVGNGNTTPTPSPTPTPAAGIDESAAAYAFYTLRPYALANPPATDLTNSHNALLVVMTSNPNFCGDLANGNIAPNSVEIDVLLMDADVTTRNVRGRLGETTRAPQVDSAKNTTCAAGVWTLTNNISMTSLPSRSGSLTVAIRAADTGASALPKSTLQASATPCAALANWPGIATTTMASVAAMGCTPAASTPASTQPTSP